MTTEYYKRISTILDPESIGSKRIDVVGCGSGGGQIADAFGRLGAQILVRDHPGETLELHNIVRHVLGHDSLGKVKHLAVADHVRRINPMAQVRSSGIDVVKDSEAFLEEVREFNPHLLVAATDNEESKFSVDAVSREIGATVVGAGVFDGGVGGEVYVTEPGGACYGCIFEKLQGKKAPQATVRHLDYANPNLPEFRSTPALGIDIAQIASICVRVGLQRLLSPTEDAFGIPKDANVVLFANRVVPGLFDQPLVARFYRIKPHPNCIVCGNAGALPETGAESLCEVGSVIPAETNSGGLQ